IYWFLPGREGSKLRVEREGYQWLAKARTEWWEECRIPRHQYIRAIKILSDKGLVFTARYKFAGRPIAHIRLNLPALLEGLQSTITKADKPTVPKADSLIPPKRTNQPYQSGQSLTKTTPETTTKTTPKNKVEPSPVTVVFEAILAHYNYPEDGGPDPIPIRAKEGSFIKKMIGRGFTPVDIIDCWLAKTKKKGQYCSMVYVNEDIKVEAPADPDKYIKGKYGHMVRR
ncbi:hypothetical protein LCGC14_3050070, partial [marine sediment metagenome]